MAKIKHGLSSHPLYRTWTGMMDRCYNKKNIGYARYGGRGITVCERWKSVARFVEDMPPKPSPAHSIERKDNNAGYSPENCTWATRSEQGRNQQSRNPISGITGVYRRKKASRIQWKASICMNYVNIDLGTFPTIKEAAEARRQGEIKYWAYPKGGANVTGCQR